MARPTDAQISELHILTTRDDAGRHFTEWSEHYEALEQMGLVAIHRPTHAATGLAYDCSHWSVEVTAGGLDYVETYPELGPGEPVEDIGNGYFEAADGTVIFSPEST